MEDDHYKLLAYLENLGSVNKSTIIDGKGFFKNSVIARTTIEQMENLGMIEYSNGQINIEISKYGIHKFKIRKEELQKEQDEKDLQKKQIESNITTNQLTSGALKSQKILTKSALAIAALSVIVSMITLAREIWRPHQVIDKETKQILQKQTTSIYSLQQSLQKIDETLQDTSAKNIIIQK